MLKQKAILLEDLVIWETAQHFVLLKKGLEVEIINEISTGTGSVLYVIFDPETGCTKSVHLDLLKLDHSTEEKYVHLIFNQWQAITIQRAMELYGRIGMGQLDMLLEHPAFQKELNNRDEISNLLNKLKEKTFRDLPGNNSFYGVRNSNTPESCKEAIDIYQVLRKATSHNKKSSYRLSRVENDEPVQYSQQPLPVCINK